MRVAELGHATTTRVGILRGQSRGCVWALVEIPRVIARGFALRAVRVRCRVCRRFAPENALGANELTAEVLAHLAEIEDRMLHLELGFPCELHLSALCAVSRHLNHGSASELFGACRRKTRRQVEVFLAAQFPKPDVRGQIRRLPVRAQEAMLANSSPFQEQQETGMDGVSPPNGAVQRNEASIAAATESVDLPPPARRRGIEPLTADRFGAHFTADAELKELIERARALASHRLPTGELSDLMKLVLRGFVRCEEARRFAVRQPPKGTVAPSAELAASAEQATSHDATPPGGASSRAREMVTRTANATSDNMRLRCRAHNQLHARDCFGASHVAAKIAETGRRVGRPSAE